MRLEEERGLLQCMALKKKKQKTHFFVSWFIFN